MPPSTSASADTLLRFLTKARHIQQNDISPKNWAIIILNLVKLFRDRFYFKDFNAFQALKNGLVGFGEEIYGRPWGKHDTDEAWYASEKPWEHTHFPDGISQHTRAIRLLRIWRHPVVLVRRSIVLTEDGRLLVRDVRVSETNDRQIEEITIQTWQLHAMVKLFADQPSCAYSLFYNICHLPEVYGRELQSRLEHARTVQLEFETRFALISRQGQQEDRKRSLRDH